MMRSLPEYTIATLLALSSPSCLFADEAPQLELRRYPLHRPLEEGDAGDIATLPSWSHLPTSPPLPLSPLSLGDRGTWWSFELPGDPSIESPISLTETYIQLDAMDARAIATLISEAIDPRNGEGGWEGGSVRLEERDGDLLVVQSPEVQAEIEFFLWQLENLHASRIRLDLALVPPGSEGEPWAADGGASVSCRLREGKEVQVLPTRGSQIAASHVVHQSTMFPEKQVYFTHLLDGLYAEATVWLLPGERRARVDLLLGRVEPAGVETRRLGPGDLDLPRWRQEQMATSLVVEIGETVAAASCELPESPGVEKAGPSPRSFTALLRVGVEAGTPSRTERSGPRTIPVGGLLAPLPLRMLAERPEEESRISFAALESESGEQPRAPSFLESPTRPVSQELRREALAEEESLLWSIAESLASERAARETPPSGTPSRRWWSEVIPGLADMSPGERGFRMYRGSLVVMEPAKTLRGVQDVLARIAREETRQVIVDIWCPSLSLVEGVRLFRPESTLEPEQLDAWTKADGAYASLRGLEGVDLSLASISARRHVADIEKVSGGGDEIRMEYGPVLQQTGAGLLVNAVARLAERTQSARLRLRGELSRAPARGRQAEVVTNEHRMGGEEERIAIDLPEVDSYVFHHDLDLPLDRPVVLEVLGDAEAPGSCRVLAVRVREVE